MYITFVDFNRFVRLFFWCAFILFFGLKDGIPCCFHFEIEVAQQADALIQKYLFMIQLKFLLTISPVVSMPWWKLLKIGVYFFSANIFILLLLLIIFFVFCLILRVSPIYLVQLYYLLKLADLFKDVGNFLLHEGASHAWMN